MPSRDAFQLSMLPDRYRDIDYGLYEAMDGMIVSDAARAMGGIRPAEGASFYNQMANVFSTMIERESYALVDEGETVRPMIASVNQMKFSENAKFVALQCFFCDEENNPSHIVNIYMPAITLAVDYQALNQQRPEYTYTQELMVFAYGLQEEQRLAHDDYGDARQSHIFFFPLKEIVIAPLQASQGTGSDAPIHIVPRSVDNYANVIYELFGRNGANGSDTWLIEFWDIEPSDDYGVDFLYNEQHMPPQSIMQLINLRRNGSLSYYAKEVVGGSTAFAQMGNHFFPKDFDDWLVKQATPVIKGRFEQPLPPKEDQYQNSNANRKRGDGAMCGPGMGSASMNRKENDSSQQFEKPSKHPIMDFCKRNRRALFLTGLIGGVALGPLAAMGGIVGAGIGVIGGLALDAAVIGSLAGYAKTAVDAIRPVTSNAYHSTAAKTANKPLSIGAAVASGTVFVANSLFNLGSSFIKLFL